MKAQEYVLRRPVNGQVIVIRDPVRRDTLLARGYELVERGHPLPPAKKGQKRRKPKAQE